MVRVRGAVAAPLVGLVGIVLMQLAWLVSVAPFAGIDEYDHVFRAASVARGEWRPQGHASGVRGELLVVPRDLVTAAEAQCRTLRYVGPRSCGVEVTRSDGAVLAGSGAARYNPAYYWLVGAVARPFTGDAAVYTMRLTSLLLCAAGLGAAAWCLLRRRRTRWSGAGLLLALAPVLVYSTMVVAPNGLEMVAGLMLWTGLLGVRGRDDPASVRCLLVATVGAVLLVTLRSLGPIFAMCTAAVVLVHRRREVAELVAERRRAVVGACAVVVAATVASAVWILTQHALRSPDVADPVTSGVVARLLPTSLLQSVAAFPARNQPAPIVVYPVYLALLAGLLAVAVGVAARWPRRALVLALVLTQALPLALSLAGTRSSGIVWQGRYGLPFTAGVAVLAGLSLEARFGTAARRLDVSRERFLAATIGVAWTAVSVICVVFVQHRQEGVTASVEDPGWWHLPIAFTALLMLAGSGLTAVALLRAPAVDRAQSSPRENAASRSCWE